MERQPRLNQLTFTHGTYPFDMGWRGAAKWRKVRTVSLLDAAYWLEITLTTEMMKKDFPDYDVHLFLNKGFICVHPEQGIHLDSNKMIARRERMPMGGCPWPKGTLALFNYDGVYNLIEKTAEADIAPQKTA